jgi:hypothetical protein
MTSMSEAIYSLIPLLMNSDVSGERLASIAALKSYPDIKYGEWLADRVGDAETSFVGYQAAVGLSVLVQKYLKTDVEKLASFTRRARGNLYLAKNMDRSQLNVIDRSHRLLKGIHSSVHKLSAREVARLKLLEGRWSGFYVQFGETTKFNMVFWFLDAATFIGVVRDEGKEDLADIDGLMDWNSGVMTFTKVYRYTHKTPVYYRGFYRTESRINGVYKVKEDSGTFSMKKKV